MEQEIFEIKYKVQHIIFRNDENKYTIFIANNIEMPKSVENKAANMKKIIIKGLFLEIFDGDYFKSDVEWVKDSQYGWQLNALNAIPIVPSNVSGIRKFLCKKIKCVGSATADTIVSAYGLNTFDKIKEGPQNLSCLKGIGKKKAEKIYTEICNYENIEKLSIFLFKNGVSDFNDVIYIYESLGDSAIPLIQENPYNLCKEISLKNLRIADSIAKQNWDKKMEHFRIEAVLRHAISTYCYSGGHIFIYDSDIRQYCNSFVKKYCSITNELTDEIICEGLLKLEENGAIKKDIFDTGETVTYLNSFYKTELYISDIIRKFISEDNSNRDFIKRKLSEFITLFQRENNVALAKNQINAIENAANSRISILSGGPGTGKTFTTNVIIRFFEFLNPQADFLLCAPTGRASKRLSELTNKEAFTVHRLLGIQNGNSLYDFVPEELDCDYLLIDEFSMVDNLMFSKILQAIEFTKTKLIIVGDYNQLPSVSPGSLLKDLINSGKVPTVILNELFRQSESSQIALNSKKILENEYIGSKNSLTFEKSKQDCLFIRQNTSEGIIDKLIQSVVYLSANTFETKDIIVLTSLHKGLLGDINLNIVLQKALNPAHPSKKEYSYGNSIFREGDKVMQLKNNYDLGVFNGETGIIDKITVTEEDTYITVTYPDYPDDIEVVYSSENISELSLAYAMTIHKAQGAEYPCVFMMCHKTLTNLNKNLIYTALTRAKKMFCTIGTYESFNEALSKDNIINRNSALAQRI